MAGLLDSIGPVTLIVKAPNQRIEDKRIACDRTWTVAQLKEHLSTVYPEKPHKDQQKLVYFGKLLKDESCLHEVLTQESYDDAHTVHLVCPSKSTQKESMTPRMPRFTSETQNQAATTPPTELRQRTQPPSTQPTSETDPQTLTIPTHEQYYEQYYRWYSQQFLQPQMDLSALSPQQKLWLRVYQQQSAMFNMQMAQMAYGGVMTDVNIGQTNSPFHAEPEPAADEAANANPNNAEDDMVMNAQGGMDAGVRANDWLDTLYAFTRFAMLMMLLYFYTTFGRFTIVLAVGIFFYLAQGNFFRLQRRIVVAPAPQNPPQNEQNQAENQNNENNERDRNTNAETDEQNNNNIEPEQAIEDPGTWMDGVKIVFTFITTFFSSLIPQNPAAIPN